LNWCLDAFLPVPTVHERWDDVLRRARVAETEKGTGIAQERGLTPGGPSRSLQRSRIVGLALALGLAIPALALSAQLRSIFGLSNRGTSADAGGLKALNHFGAWHAGGGSNGVRLLGTRAGFSFYAARGTEDTLCFAIAIVSTPRPKPGALACLSNRPNRFPSAQQPILDFSPLASGGNLHGTHVAALIGFAADGVARVGVVDETGVLHSVPVIKNLYATQKGALPNVAEKALVALDVKGRKIYQRAYVP
jgi:hypothetical protein